MSFAMDVNFICWSQDLYIRILSLVCKGTTILQSVLLYTCRIIKIHDAYMNPMPCLPSFFRFVCPKVKQAWRRWESWVIRWYWKLWNFGIQEIFWCWYGNPKNPPEFFFEQKSKKSTFEAKKSSNYTFYENQRKRLEKVHRPWWILCMVY